MSELNVVSAGAVSAIITGMVLLMGFPWWGLVVPGILLGTDLTIHGTWWLALGLLARRPAAVPSTMAQAG